MVFPQIFSCWQDAPDPVSSEGNPILGSSLVTYFTVTGADPRAPLASGISRPPSATAAGSVGGTQSRLSLDQLDLTILAVEDDLMDLFQLAVVPHRLNFQSCRPDVGVEPFNHCEFFPGGFFPALGCLAGGGGGVRYSGGTS